MSKRNNIKDNKKDNNFATGVGAVVGTAIGVGVAQAIVNSDGTEKEVQVAQASLEESLPIEIEENLSVAEHLEVEKSPEVSENHEIVHAPEVSVQPTEVHETESVAMNVTETFSSDNVVSLPEEDVHPISEPVVSYQDEPSLHEIASAQEIVSDPLTFIPDDNPAMFLPDNFGGSHISSQDYVNNADVSDFTMA